MAEYLLLVKQYRNAVVSGFAPNNTMFSAIYIFTQIRIKNPLYIMGMGKYM